MNIGSGCIVTGTVQRRIEPRRRRLWTPRHGHTAVGSNGKLASVVGFEAPMSLHESLADFVLQLGQDSENDDRI